LFVVKMAEHSLLNTTFPVILPDVPEIFLSKAEFEQYIESLVAPTTLPTRPKDEDGKTEETVEEATSVAATPSEQTKEQNENDAPFMKGLLSDKATVPSFDDRDGKMLTENADVAHRTSGQALVDLFFELEDVISASRMKTTLENAWQVDSESTLKIIWNARSIHLGKSSRNTFYRAVGWLAENHPLTLLANLQWLVRPLIPKKAPKKAEKKDGESSDIEIVDAKDADSDFELVDANDEELEGQPEQKKVRLESEVSEFDVKFGVSHGYWKDLLNILALSANDQLKVDGDPKSILNVSKPKEKPWKRDWTKGKKKTVNEERHSRTVAKLENDGFYKALHLTVARLFVDQLKTDLTRLQSGQKAEIKRITLAAKWAPTHKGMHDQHTTIVSTIAELLHPFDKVCPEGVDPADRETYLRHARVVYQSQTLSPLRKHLNIVERDITAETFSEIKYERVPSLAMARYTPLFAKKDFDHFDKYIEMVASGKSKISGATLLPSTLVSAVSGYSSPYMQGTQKGADALVQKKLREVQLKTIDGQWTTLVQRIRDSGTLESSIAVCDVSGSMSGPRFSDGTCPMDSSIGLSLLLAEVTKPPFGGAFITFSHRPQVMRVGGPEDKRSFKEKVKYIQDSNWSMNTDFVAVFETLILPMAVDNEISQEDMVKQVFVFSDMQFDMAGGDDRWTTSYERIKKQFEDAGYEMPMLIFWNLAGGRVGYGQTHLNDGGEGEDAAPKPVTAAEEGTALMSGYSQGQLKMFLDNGTFEDPEEEQEDEVEEKEGDDGEVVIQKKEKKKKDPLGVVKKAISHEAYSMLKVVD
jgi:hypothetical protein